MENKPKEIFLQLFYTVSFFAAAIAFLGAVFQGLNALLPDAVDYNGGFSEGAMRLSLAVLLVLTPSCLWVAGKLRKIKPTSRLRIWLTYFTVFISALVFIVDLIVVLNSFFGGEITLRFVFKAVAVFLAAGLTFFYFRKELEVFSETSKQPKMFAILFAGLASLALVFGFWSAGSPWTARDKNLDVRRVNDLNMIQSYVLATWQKSGVLPETVEGVAVDPQSGAPYKYRKTAALSFEICATFAQPEESSKFNYPSYPGQSLSTADDWYNFSHGLGEACFTRIIDPKVQSLNKS